MILAVRVSEGSGGLSWNMSVQDRKKFEELVHWVDAHPGKGGVIFVVSSRTFPHVLMQTRLWLM